MLALLSLIIAALAALFLITGSDGGVSHVSALAIAAVVAGALLTLYLATLRAGASETGNPRRRFFAGAVIAVAIAAGYFAYGGGADLLPSTGRTDIAERAPRDQNALASVRIRRGDDGRITARGRANGVALDFLIDSGSSAVILKSSDAEKAGIDVKAAVFETPIATAAGEAMFAPARLTSVEIGPIQIADVEAFIAKPGTLNESLLGQSFLRRLSSYEMVGDFVTLRQ